MTHTTAYIITVDELVSLWNKQDKTLIEVTTRTEPADAFATLIEHDILSAPVWDEEKKEYTGFIDMRDIISSVVYAHQLQGVCHQRPFCGE